MKISKGEVGHSSFQCFHYRSTGMLILSACIFCVPLYAAFEYDGCGTLQNSDFRQEVLISKIPTFNPAVLLPALNEPIDMEFVTDEQGNVNFYYVERQGNLRFFNAATKEVTGAGKITVSNNQNHGLVGIVKDPGYETNHWMYLYYTHPDLDVIRVSRFIVDEGSHQFLLDSEKPILEFPVIDESGIYHTGGAMKFDAYGDMWISVGDVNGLGDFCSTTNPKSSGEDGPANTHSFLGSILRITLIPFSDNQSPTPGLGSTYTVPDGNFGDYFAEVYPDRAGEFKDTSLVRPEVYAKGTRNPYTLALEPIRRWIGWGDCGPDVSASLETEEHNLITHPAFMGWPYFAGDNKSLNCNKDPQAPVNVNPLNTGLELLPPATPAILPYPRRCAMTGPIYRYDGDLQSNVKMPPHFNKIWFITDFNNPVFIKAVVLDSTGTQILQNEEIFTDMDFSRILALKLGPDGALYVNNYSGWYNSDQNTNISRIIYTGDCLPDEPKLETVGCMDARYEEYDANAIVQTEGACQTLRIRTRLEGVAGGIVIDKLSVSISAEGAHSVRVSNIKGEEVYVLHGRGPHLYALTGLGKPGVYVIDVETRTGSVSERIVVF